MDKEQWLEWQLEQNGVPDLPEFSYLESRLGAGENPPPVNEPPPWYPIEPSIRAFALKYITLRTITSSHLSSNKLDIYHGSSVDDGALMPTTEIRIWGEDVYKLRGILNEVFAKKPINWKTSGRYTTNSFGEVIRHD